MVPELPYRSEVAGSVNAFSKLTNTIKGDPLSTSVSTNVAISGEGFFMVQERVGYAGNQPSSAISTTTPAAAISRSTRTGISTTAPASICADRRSTR